MKISEIKSLDSNALDEKLSELRKELVKINAQIAIGTALKNPGQVREIKKTIARIMGVKWAKNKENNKVTKTKKSEKNSEVAAKKGLPEHPLKTRR